MADARKFCTHSATITELNPTTGNQDVVERNIRVTLCVQNSRRHRSQQREP